MATNETVFTRGLRGAVQPSLATVTRLDSTLALDERIIALREIARPRGILAVYAAALTLAVRRYDKQTG